METKDAHKSPRNTRQTATENPTNIQQVSDKAHVIALALHHDGLGVGHGVIAGVTMPRTIRPYTDNAKRAS